MKQFVVDYLNEQCQQAERINRCARDEYDADLLIELAGGKKVAVYVINRALRLPEIRERYQQNTRRKIHTLFVVDGRMLPFEQTEGDPPLWMSALHMLTHGRVYAYSCDRRSVSIRPVHIEWRWGDAARRVELGRPVDVADLRPSSITAGSHQLDGTFATADFGEGAFWKKRDPNEARQFNYSWHNWSFGGAPKQRPEAEADWDPWEEFQRHYGDASAYQPSDEDVPFDFEFGTFGGASGSSTLTRPKPAAQTHHYVALGLTSTGAHTLEDVKRAYRRKARENHPDMHPAEKEKYTARMAEINAAFEAISKDLE